MSGDTRWLLPLPGGTAVTVVVHSTEPTVVADVERAAAANGLLLEPLPADPRFAEPVGENEVAGLAVAFKALVVRAGGQVKITAAELEHARTLLARVDADPEEMWVQVVDGDPPETPRFAAEGA